MIINNISPTRVETPVAKKTMQKNGAKSKFSIFSEEEHDNNQPQHINSIPDINPFIYLQEHHTQDEDEREDLQKATKEILNALNKIRIKLLSDDLKIDDLRQLKLIINSQTGVFKSPEVQELYNQVRIKAETELAKYDDQLKIQI